MPLRCFFVITLIWLSAAHVAEAQQQKVKLVRVTYPVAELVTPIPGRAGAENHDRLVQSLMDVVTNTVAPTTWRDAGGQGSAQYFPLGQALVVNQTADVHTEIARLLEQLHKSVKTPGKGNTHQGGVEEQAIPEPKKTKEFAIQHRLKQPISFNFKDVPLETALKELSTISAIPFVTDAQAMKEARMDVKSPISCNVEEVDMKFALNILLNPLKLTFVVENDVLTITTAQRRKGGLIRVSYPVGDLIEIALATTDNQPAEPLDIVLKKLIVDTIGKDSWEQTGGGGTIHYFPHGKSLVISQFQETHEEIQLLLATLRKLQDLRVSLDVRFVTANEDSAKFWRKQVSSDGRDVVTMRFEDPNPPGQFVQRQGLRIVPKDTPPTNETRKTVSMEQRHVQFLFDAGSKEGCTILHLPRVIVYNGQRLPLECKQKEVAVADLYVWSTQIIANAKPHAKASKDPVRVVSSEKSPVAWRCEATPVVSADRRFVRLNLTVEHSAAESESVQRILKGTKTFNLADGHTVVWDFGMSVANQHLFVLVTPRVVISEEVEPIFLGKVEPIPGR